MGMEEQELEKKVEIVLKTIGPARPSRLLLPSSIKVSLLTSSFPLQFSSSAFFIFNSTISIHTVLIHCYCPLFLWGVGKTKKESKLIPFSQMTMILG